MAAATTTSSYSSSSISSLSTSIMQELLVINFHSSRKLLLHNPLYNTPPLPTPPPSQQPTRQNNTFDANVVMVLSVLLCALICSLGLNSIIRCALRCSSLVGSADSADSPQAQQCQLANTGIKKKALKTFLTISFSADLKLPGLDTECAICLSEFTAGERVRVLPKCHHGFHVRCIDKWLNCHSSCPTCRHCLIETCNKIVASTTTARPSQSLIVEEVCVRIEPLHPEGLIRNYQT